MIAVRSVSLFVCKWPDFGLSMPSKSYSRLSLLRCAVSVVAARSELYTRCMFVFTPCTFLFLKQEIARVAKKFRRLAERHGLESMTAASNRLRAHLHAVVSRGVQEGESPSELSAAPPRPPPLARQLF